LGQIVSVGSDISGRVVKTGNVMLDDFLNGKSDVIPTGENAKLPTSKSKLPKSGKVKLPESGNQVSPLARNNINNIQSTARNTVLSGTAGNTVLSGTKPEIVLSNDEKFTMLGIDNKNNLNSIISKNDLPVKEGIGSKSGFVSKPSGAFSEDTPAHNTPQRGSTSWKGSDKATAGYTSPSFARLIGSSASPATPFKLSSIISSYTSPVASSKSSPSPISKSQASVSPISSSKSSQSPVSSTSPSPKSSSPKSSSPKSSSPSSISPSSNSPKSSSPSSTSPSPNPSSPSPTSPSPSSPGSPSPSPASPSPTSPSPTSPSTSSSPSPSPASPSPKGVASPSPSPYSHEDKSKDEKKPRRKNDAQDLFHKSLMADVDKLVSTTKVQTFKEAVDGDAVNPTAITRADYEKMLRTTAPQAPKTMASKLPLRNATMAQVGGTPNKIQQAAKQQEIKQKQMQAQAKPPMKAPNQISKDDLNKVSSGVQRKIMASQKANQGRMQAVPTNVRPTTTTTSSSSISKLQNMIQPAQKKSMSSMITGKKARVRNNNF
jgi:hypothetical protein